MFSACDENPNDNGNGNSNGNGNLGGTKITATNVINSSSRIATVKAAIYTESGGDWGYDVIAPAPYKGNGFTLELPATVSDKYLLLLTTDVPSGITISDRTAKCTNISIQAFDKDDNRIGSFALGKSDDDADNEVMWLYVDKNVTIKGEFKDYDDEESNREYISKYDMDMKKGWNIVYMMESESHNNSTGRDVYTSTLTTQKPSGVNFVWYFDGYGDYASLKSAKLLSKNKSFFQKRK
jgi:hypothetical protein